MKISTLDTRDAIHKQLMLVSKCVDGFAQKEPSAVDRWAGWLKNMEEVFKTYNLSECSELAGYRSTIILANSIHEGSINAKRKRVFAKALETVQPAQTVCVERFKKLEDTIEAVRTLVRQVLVPAKTAGCIQFDPEVDFTIYMEDLLQQFRSHEQLAPIINTAISLVGKQDVFRLLVEEIDFE